MKSAFDRERPLRFLRGILAPLLEAFVPPLCAACLGDLDSSEPLLCSRCLAAQARDGGWLCLRCGRGLEGRARLLERRGCARASHRSFRARCLYRMRPPVSDMVHRFKYEGVTRLARHWGGELGEWLAPLRQAGAVELVLPVPLHASRLRERGYNQAALLARAACLGAGLPCIEDALVRRRKTRSQTALAAEGREENLRGAFRVARPALVEGRRVALVDDVVTSGSTLSAAAAALLLAGAREVVSLAVARA